MSRLQLLQRLDVILLTATALLLIVGLIILNAITIKEGAVTADFNPYRQMTFALLGTGLLIGATRFHFQQWRRFAPLFYGVGLLFLILVLLIGQSAFGATRWINIGWLQFQPAEFIKLGLVLYLAHFFSRHYEQLKKWQYFCLSLLIVLVPMALVLLQPDLGSSLVLGFIWLVMVLNTPTRKFFIVAMVALMVALLPVVVSQLQPYQRQRIETFLDPASDPQGAGYNVTQAKIAVGSGQLFGRGLNSGSQSQLNFLPSQHTDFVFAVLAEKLGFVGAGLVLLLFIVLLSRMLNIASKAEDRFSFFISLGLFAMFLIHIVVNVGMNLQLLPVTGIPLPFLSYGGTNLIISLISIGMLQSIVLHRQGLAFKE